MVAIMLYLWHNERQGRQRPPRGKEVTISARYAPDAPHGAMPIISIRAGRDPDVYRTQNRDGGKTPKKIWYRSSHGNIDTVPHDSRDPPSTRRVETPR